MIKPIARIERGGVLVLLTILLLAPCLQGQERPHATSVVLPVQNEATRDAEPALACGPGNAGDGRNRQIWLIDESKHQHCTQATAGNYEWIDMGGGSDFSGLPVGSIPFADGSTDLATSTGLFWNDSNNRLGVNNPDPRRNLDIIGSFSVRRSGVISGPHILLGIDGFQANIAATDDEGSNLVPLTFSAGNNEVMRLATNGNVGLGAIPPDSDLHIFNTGTADIQFETTGTSTSALLFTEAGGIFGLKVEYDPVSNTLSIISVNSSNVIVTLTDTGIVTIDGTNGGSQGIVILRGTGGACIQMQDDDSTDFSHFTMRDGAFFPVVGSC